jgi:transposase-like protein
LLLEFKDDRRPDLWQNKDAISCQEVEAAMNIIESAWDFVKKLLDPTDPWRCPYCHQRMTKKHGFYTVTIRDVGGVHQEKVQRYWCHLCHCTYSPPDPRREARARYTSQVRRKALDLYFHVGSSLRAAAQWLRSEINQGTERALIWNPLLRLQPPAETIARLNHSSVWHWEQEAAQRVQRQAQQGRLQRLIRFSGALVADASAIYIRGVPTPLHLIADAVTRVGLVVGRLRTESETVIAGQFRLALAWWALRAEDVRVLISDGAAYYRYVLDRVLRWAKQQRSLFHLWRNITPHLQAFAEHAADEAMDILHDMIHAVWDAPSLQEAQDAFSALQSLWSHVPELQLVIQLIGKTLEEALLHTSQVVDGMGRTSNVAERFFRRYRQRIRRMGCFMSNGGCDAFNLLWLTYINLEPYQRRQERKRRYRHPGL